jgi:phosphate transport system protein
MTKHTVKAYDKELEELKNEILDMGRMAESQLTNVLEAFINKDLQRAQYIVEQDPRVNELEHDVNRLTVHLLAARQPLAIDLRTIISALKIATELERIADYAKNIAKQVLSLNGEIPSDPLCDVIIEIADIARVMLSKVLEAYIESDVDKALDVRQRDTEIDERYASLLAELRICMMDDAQNVDTCTAMLFMARCLERIGDHIKNVAEDIYFIVSGKIYEKEATFTGYVSRKC